MRKTVNNNEVRNLAGRAAEGDSDALNDLIENIYQIARGAAGERFKGDPYMLDEASQLTVIRAADCLDKLSGCKSPVGYIMKMTYHICEDLNRRDNKKSRDGRPRNVPLNKTNDEGVEIGLSIPDRHDRMQPEKAAHVRAVDQLIQHYFASLPKNERDAVELVDFCRMSRQAAADALGIRKTTLDGRYSMAWKHLKKALQKDLDEGTVEEDDFRGVFSFCLCLHACMLTGLSVSPQKSRTSDQMPCTSENQEILLIPIAERNKHEQQKFLSHRRYCHDPAESLYR